MMPIEPNTQPRPRTRVFLALEIRLLRDRLARVLSRQEDIEVVGQSAPKNTTVDEIVESGSNVILVDRIDRELFSKRKECLPSAGRSIKIVAIGMDPEREQFLEAVRTGVIGYLLKDASTSDVLAAVRSATRNEATCSPRMYTMLFKAFEQPQIGSLMKESKGELGLTLRQRGLMKLVGNGLTNKEIAQQLRLSEFTIKNHMSRILRQLHAGNRMEAAQIVKASVPLQA